MLFIVRLVCLLTLSLSAQAWAGNYNVTNTGDSGMGSLRQAILDANAHPNSDPGAPDTISFAIPGGGPHTITPATGLPIISDAVVIDGYTQPGARANTLSVTNDAVILIELNGGGATLNGLTITSGDSTVRGLVINGFSGGTGIWITDNGNNKVEGCFIGTNATGTEELNNQGGILITNAPNNTIGGTTPAARNIILGKEFPAIDLQFSSSDAPGGLIVQGNYLGTDATGTSVLGNGVIRLTPSNNLIGGTDAGAGNVISVADGPAGFTLGGVRVERGGGNTIQGNYIGVTADGEASLGAGNGIWLLESSQNVIGGSTVSARNIIASPTTAIRISTGTPRSADHNVIEGNYIGTNATGMSLVPENGSAGSGVLVAADQNTIVRNVIAGFVWGVNLSTRGSPLGGSNRNQVQGNFIGTDALGKNALPNGNGILIYGPLGKFSPPSQFNQIGGAEPGAGNVLSGNNDRGITILGGSNNSIQGNLIGVAADGSTPLPNGNGGIYVVDTDGFEPFSGRGNVIGGTEPGAGNVIAYNGTSNVPDVNGIRIQSGTGNSILGNSIFANYGLGVDLGGGNIPTPNDPGDADSGPNDFQNFPVLTSADLAGDTVTMHGTLDSIAGLTYRIEFFGNSTTDPSLFGEGTVFLGATTATIGADGTGIGPSIASFDVALPCPVGIRTVNATATAPNGNTSEFSQNFSIAGSPASQLLNIATRLNVQTEDRVLIGGFIVSGTESKQVLVRAIGPSLTVQGALTDPALELFQGGSLLASNNNWRDTQEAEIEATGIPPSNDLESAVVRTLAPGAYTAVMRGHEDAVGIGLVEIYDVAPSISQLANISSRGFVGSGDSVMIGGLIIGPVGATDGTVLVRAIGPTLSKFGIEDSLQDPTLALVNSSGDVVRSNDNWRESQEAEIIAAGLPPGDDRESALIQVVAPGSYTAIVRGANDTTGVALVEVYRLTTIPGPTPTPGTPTPTPTPEGSATPTPTPSETPTPTPIACSSGILSENFDSLTPPALPSGWEARNASGPAPLWVTSNSGVPAPVAESLPNAASIDDPDALSDKRLDSVPYLISKGAQLVFRNNYDLESDFDGGVLEISIGGGTFLDIMAAGGILAAGGYNATISTSFGSPLSGRAAWSGSSAGFVETIVNLPSSAEGQTVVFRWRMGSDVSGSSSGWRVDSIQLFCNGGVPTPTPTPTPSPTPTPTPAPQTVALPVANLDTSVPLGTVIVHPVTTTDITVAEDYVGFQGDFIFDSSVVTFSEPFVEAAGLTASNWNVKANILPGVGLMRRLRVSAFSLTFKPLSSSGILYNLRMLRVSATPGASTPLVWQQDPDNFIFIDEDLDIHPPNQANGLITITTP